MIATLRSAVAQDGEAIFDILSGWIDETPWMPRIHTHEEDRAFGKWLVEVCDVTVAEKDQQVVGFLARQGADIQALYLHKSARGQGLGTALLDHAKTKSAELGLWTFQANTPAQRFYLANGFTENQRTDGQGNDEKLPDIHFQWVRDGA